MHLVSATAMLVMALGMPAAAVAAAPDDAQAPDPPRDRQSDQQSDQQSDRQFMAAQLTVVRDPADRPRADYRVPDLVPDRKLIPSLGTDILSADVGAELILDRTGFRQDAASLAQLGRQQDLFEVRSASLEVSGDIGASRIMRYKFGIEYNGFDVDPARNWAITDVNIGFALPQWRAIVSIGQMREDFGYEVIGSTATMPQGERILTSFAAPNNTGLKLALLFGARDATRLSVGLFKDEWGEGDGRPALSARLSHLAIDDPGRRRFLHLGVAVRQAASSGTVRYRDRPGVAAADDFVDTGDIPAQASTHIGFEAHWSDGPFSLIAERAVAHVDGTIGFNPRFHAFYVLGSWVPTGESRRYDRAKGVPGRIIPQGRWGAPELVARYAIVDLDDGPIRGGRYDRLELGVNWWATSRWKFGLLYGSVRLDRFGRQGSTQSLLTRIQWVN